MRAFRDTRLFRREGVISSRTSIGLLTVAVRNVYAQYVLWFRDMSVYSRDEARNMLVLQAIHSIYWDVTFADVEILPTDCSFYYDWNTGFVTGRPAETVIGKTIPAVTPLFLQNDLRATLTDFKSNVRAYRQSEWEAQQSTNVRSLNKNWRRNVRSNLRC